MVNNKFGLDLDYFIDLVYFKVHDCSPRATIRIVENTFLNKYKWFLWTSSAFRNYVLNIIFNFCIKKVLVRLGKVRIGLVIIFF